MSIVSFVKKHRVFIGLFMITAMFFIGASSHAVVLESGIPGVGEGGAQGAKAPNLPTYINYLYIFVLGFVGIAGFISLVIWGTVWVGSAVVDKKAMAMDGIKNALTGIGIAFTAFIMLYTINPDLTIIKMPQADKLVVKKPTQAPTYKGKSTLSRDGGQCIKADSECYPGSKCVGVIWENGIVVPPFGKCERITNTANNINAKCAPMDNSPEVCAFTYEGMCKSCIMPDDSRRCIDKNNSFDICAK